MPKHGWKWRTERIRALTQDELEELVKSSSELFWTHYSPRERDWTPRHDAWCTWLAHGKMTPLVRQSFRRLPAEKKQQIGLNRRTRITPKLAKWIYRNLAPDQKLYEFSTQDISFNLLKLIAHYQRPIPWRHSFFWNEVERWKSYEFGMMVIWAMPLVAVYEDAQRYIELYDDATAHPLVRGEAIFGLLYVYDRWDSAIRETCRRALTDPENPYARCGGCFLAEGIECCREEVEALLTDETPERPGWRPVSASAKECIAEWTRREEDKAQFEALWPA